MAKKAKYCEGTWFAVPLRGGGYVVGLLARRSPGGGVMLCYFFGPKRDQVPGLIEVDGLCASDAHRILRVSDMGLRRGDWPIIGQSTGWDRSEWPMPAFIRRELLSTRAWKVEYADDDPINNIRESVWPHDDESLEENSLYGDQAAEIVLSKQFG